LWTLGLFIAAVGITTVVFMRHRHAAVILHGTTASHDGLLTLVVVACLIGGFVLVRQGLSPIHRLRSRLGAVRSGAEPRITGSYPSEVQPLVDDLNDLLDHRDRAVQRAVAKAGDLAHGLKTPLAVLSQEAERARALGHAALAESVSEQVLLMRRQIDYHLAHARAAASGATLGATSNLRESLEALVRTMHRLHAGRTLDVQIHVAPGATVRVQREDLDEMLGNLLDNACKWGRSTVALSAGRITGGVEVLVDDDGPGLAGEARQAVLQRGVRADEAVPGSGLGLAIVRDLAELYGGSIAIDASPAGGVRARLRLPA